MKKPNIILNKRITYFLKELKTKKTNKIEVGIILNKIIFFLLLEIK